METLQRSTREETVSVLHRVAAAYTLDERIRAFEAVKTPANTASAWQLSQHARISLKLRWAEDPSVPALAWAQERGRISSSEYQALTGVSGPTAVKHLKELAAAKGLMPSSPSGRGRGFHYLYPAGTRI